MVSGIEASGSEASVHVQSEKGDVNIMLTVAGYDTKYLDKVFLHHNDKLGNVFLSHSNKLDKAFLSHSNKLGKAFLFPFLSSGFIIKPYSI